MAAGEHPLFVFGAAVEVETFEKGPVWILKHAGIARKQANIGAWWG
jgi:hypothetical protein